MSKCEGSGLEGLGLLFGIVVLVAILVVAGVVWFLIATCIAAWRYHHYLKQAEADFEQMAREHGLNFPGAEVIETVHSVGVHPDGGYKTVSGWAAGTLFGVEEYEEL